MTRAASAKKGHSTAGQVTSWWPGSKESLEGSDCHKHPPSAIYFLPRLPMFPEPLKIVPAAGDQGGAHCPEIKAVSDVFPPVLVLWEKCLF